MKRVQGIKEGKGKGREEWKGEEREEHSASPLAKA